MLSVSFEAFYAMDNLRHRSNITYAQMAEIIGIHDSQYRRIVRKIADGELGGLHGHVDRKVRKGIALITFGLLDDSLPLKRGKSAQEVEARSNTVKSIVIRFEAVWEKVQISNDPTDYLNSKINGSDQSISTRALISHGHQFTGWAS